MTLSPLLLAALTLAACASPTDGGPAAPEVGPPPAPEATVPPVPEAAALPDSAYWRAYFEGAWTGLGDAGQPGLACGRDLSVRFDDTPDPMCVVANQIWISARWTLDAEAGVAQLLLVDPDDVGSGGADLPWDGFSRTQPLATLEPTPGEGRFATLVWHGFRMADGQPYGDDFGDWLAGDYEPSDGDTRLPDAR